LARLWLASPGANGLPVPFAAGSCSIELPETFPRRSIQSFHTLAAVAILGRKSRLKRHGQARATLT
jgi:hypothetical protein